MAAEELGNLVSMALALAEDREAMAVMACHLISAPDQMLRGAVAVEEEARLGLELAGLAVVAMESQAADLQTVEWQTLAAEAEAAQADSIRAQVAVELFASSSRVHKGKKC